MRVLLAADAMSRELRKQDRTPRKSVKSKRKGVKKES